MNNSNEKINQEEENSEKYFDESNYSTIIVGQDKFASPKKLLSDDLVDMLNTSDKTLKDQALAILKKENAQEALINAIEDDEYLSSRPTLIAACWECGLDFGKYSDVFTELAGDSNAFVSLEAITVLENIEKFEPEGKIDEVIVKLEYLVNKHHPNSGLIEGLIDLLKEHKSSPKEDEN